MEENDQYASFMIRLWPLKKNKEPGEQAGWHMEVEHIQSGQSFIVESFEHLVEQMKDHVDFRSLGEGWRADELSNSNNQ